MYTQYILYFLYMCCAVLCFAIHAVTYIWLCEHLYLTLRAYSSRASYSRNLPHQNTAQHKYSTSVILSSSRHHSHRQRRDTNLSLTTLHHRRAGSLGHGLVRPRKMVRRRKELRLWHRVRPAALRETTQPKRRTATLQQGRRVSQLCRASEPDVPGHLSSLTALWYGTVQQSTPKHKPEPWPTSQPADTSRPSRPFQERRHCQRARETRPGLAAGELNGGSKPQSSPGQPRPNRGQPCAPCLPKIKDSRFRRGAQREKKTGRCGSNQAFRRVLHGSSVGGVLILIFFAPRANPTHYILYIVNWEACGWATRAGKALRR